MYATARPPNSTTPETTASATNGPTKILSYPGIHSRRVAIRPNKEIAAEDLSKVLGEDQIKALMTHSGLSRDELVAGLSQQLPELINKLTPNGRLPTEHEVSRLI